MTSYAPYAGSKRADISLFGPLFLFLAAFIILVATLPLSGISIPGARRIASVLDRIPQPWKPAKPTHVLAPEVDMALAAAPAAGSVAPAPGTGQPAPGIPAPALSAASVPAPAPVAPVPPAVHPALAAPLPASFRQENFRHQYQTWNNCGPATISMALSHFGRPEQQSHAAAFLKPNASDKNVGPDELVTYARSVGLRADLIMAGDMNRLKRLVANDIPVVIQMWFTPHPNDGMGHFRLLMGYDDAAQQVIVYDSYQTPGVNVRLSYAAFDQDWRVFNRPFIPVYPAEKADLVTAILGPDRDETAMRQRALAESQAETITRPNDPYSWFNTGTALTQLGRTGEAIQAFDRARALKLPWRMLWYQFAPFEAYLAEGRVNDVLALTNANLQQANDLEESLYYRGKALEAQGQPAQARASYQAAIRSNPKYGPALHALSLIG